MLPTLLVVLACLKFAPAQEYSSSDAYAPKSDGDNYNVGYGSDIIGDIRAVAANVSSLYVAVKNTGDRLSSLVDDGELNSDFTKNFFYELYPTVRERQRAQTAEINNLERRVDILVGQSEEVAEVAESIRQIENQLQKLAADAKQIENDIAYVQGVNNDQANKIADASNRLDKQDAEVDDVEEASAAVSARLQSVRNALKEVIEVIQTYYAAAVTVTVDADEPSKTVDFGEDFAVGYPIVQYGISAIYIENDSQSRVYTKPAYGANSYGYSAVVEEPRINFDVDVVYSTSTNSATVTLNGRSTGGWVVTKATVQILVLYLDDRIIQFNEEVKSY